MTKSHHDKVAVISGAASGIGQAFAHRLAQDGAHIVIADMLPAADTVRLVKDAGSDVLAWEGDVSSESSVNSLLAEVVARFGALRSPCRLRRHLSPEAVCRNDVR
jgi:NAD(P)-dependent dehydrogenase (short-subunit alcohol dehydrogenase family)